MIGSLLQLDASDYDEPTYFEVTLRDQHQTWITPSSNQGTMAGLVTL